MRFYTWLCTVISWPAWLTEGETERDGKRESETDKERQRYKEREILPSDVRCLLTSNTHHAESKRQNQ